MTIEEVIRLALGAMEGKLIDSGWTAAARDAELRKKVENALREHLHAPADEIPRPLDDVALQLNNIAELLRAQQQAAEPDEFACSVFLGAGVHFPPPKYASNDSQEAYPPEVRPPVGSALAKELAQHCEFARNFPNENDGDWMRVATWHERVNNRGGLTGLEGRIKAAVQTGKRGSEMLATIASWPCRNFYTTNFDTHLETALLKQHKEVFVWVYTPSLEGDLRRYWWRMKDNGEFAKWEEAWVHAPASGVPAQPPADAVVVFKLHGDVRVPGSLVITEDDYIKFLRRVAKQQLPARLLLPLSRTLIFIGYSLRDFNMRYILSMLREERSNWQPQELSYSVDLRPDPLIRETWQNRDQVITFIEHNLWDVIPAVQQRIVARPTQGAT